MIILNNFIKQKITSQTALSFGIAGYENIGLAKTRIDIFNKYSTKWYGVDNNKSYIKKHNQAQNLFYVDLNKNNYYHRLPKDIDIIIITEVLEHLKSPINTLSYITRHKAKNTRLLISVPNGGSAGKFLLGFISKNKFKQQDQKHFYLFNQQTLTNLCTASGLANFRIYPYVQTNLRYHILKFFPHLASGFVAWGY